jgi:hypothetical protein
MDRKRLILPENPPLNTMIAHIDFSTPGLATSADRTLKLDWFVHVPSIIPVSNEGTPCAPRPRLP